MNKINAEEKIRSLNPDGDCLGIALSKCWEIMGAKPIEKIDFTQLYSVSDAIQAMSIIRPPKILIRKKSFFLEKSILRMNSKRFGIGYVYGNSLPPSYTAVCLRSLRQLYGVNIWRRHWICIKTTTEESIAYDPLLKVVKEKFNNLKLANCASIIEQAGPTLIY